MNARSVALLASALLLAACASPARAPEEAVQVTHGNHLDPSFSPDGSQMVVVSIVDGVEQLSILDADGTMVRRLTSDPYNHEDPSWSPDGRMIAFVSLENDGAAIYVMNADGSGRRQITPANRRNIHPTWTPDSRALLYCSNGDVTPPARNNAEIYRTNLATGETQTLIAGGVNTYPNMSPDGRWIAFRRVVEETNSEVWIARADGGEPRNLTNHAAFDGWPSWSPDSQRIAFASDRGGNQQIHVMNADGSGVVRIAATPDRGTAPQWSKDGARVHFPVCSRGACEIFSAAAPAR